ncbi:MAG: hypothetical protein WAL80_03930 [Xanthobacteraceae bacterium]
MTNTGVGAITVETSGSVLDLESATISGGTITDTVNGTINVSGTSTLENGATLKGGGIADSGTLDISGTVTVENGAEITGGALSIGAGATLDAETASGAILNDVDVTVATGGTLQVDPITSGSLVPLTLENGTSVTGGTLLINSGGEVIIASGGATLDDAIVTNNKTLLINSGTTLTLDGGTVISGNTITDNGTIDVTGAATINGGANLTGGQVTVESGQTLTLDGATLTNTTVNDIGTLNIDANNTLTLSGASGVTIDGSTSSNGTVDNSGTVALGSSTLTLLSGGFLTLDDGGKLTLSGGTISGTGGATLANAGNTISGFGAIGIGSPNTLNLDNQSGGTIEALGGTLTVKINSAVSNEGTLEAASAATLKITVGAIDNTGNIQVDGTLAADQPTANGGKLTLNDGGTVTLAGGTIDSDVSGNQLKNSGNAISGFGQIGDGTDNNLTLNNASGTVEASGGILTLDTRNTILNAGTLEAASGATLQVDDVTINNTGNIQVDGTLKFAAQTTLTGGGTLTLAGGSISGSASGDGLQNSGNTISGTGQIGDGTDNDLALNNASGTIEASGGTLTITTDSPTAIVNSGTLEAASGAILQIDDGVHNSGAIEALGTGSVNVAGSGVNNVSGGTITAEDAGSSISIGGSVSSVNNNLVEAESGSITFTTGVSNTGTGTIEALASGSLVTIDGSSVSNASGGTVEAVDAGSTITIAGNFAALNSGLIEAQSGTVAIGGAGIVNQSGGVIEAANSGATVSFAVSSPLDSVTNQSGGIIEAQDGATLVLDDLTINNGGTIELNGSSSTTQMTIEGTVRLGPFEVIASGQILSSDAGSVTLTDSSDNQIVSDGAAATLHIADNTISGAGTMGDADLTLDNDSGTIDATGALAINAFTINNSGLLEATGGGSLQISGSGAGSTLANDGTLEANGGTVTLGGNVAISGTGSVTITGGGTADFQSFFSQDVTFSGSGGTLELSHPGSFDPSGGTGSTISGFAAGDTLDLQAYNAQAGDAFTVSASFDSGTDTTTLTVTDPSVSNTDTQSIEFAGDYSTATLAAANLAWSVTADGTGGVNVTEQSLPVVSLNQTSPVTTNEGTALTLNTLSVSEAHASDTLTVTLDVSDGTLALGSAAGLAGDSGLGTGSVTLNGTAAEIDTALATGVTYTPNSGFAGTDNLVVDASDGPFDANPQTLAINVAPVAQAPLLSGPSISDSLDSATLNTVLWNVYLPTVDGATNAPSVTPTAGGLELNNHGYLQTVAGFTPGAAAPLDVAFSFTLNSTGGYVALTDSTNGATNSDFGEPANGIEFMANWLPGHIQIDDVSTGQSSGEISAPGNFFVQGDTYQVSITDNGSSQTLTVIDATDPAAGSVSTTTNFTDPAAGDLVTFTNRESTSNAGGPYTATISDVSISPVTAYEAFENGSVTLAGIAASVVDPSETLSLVLSGFANGTTFSAGEAGTGAYVGDWVLDQNDISGLATTPLTMTPPADSYGTFNLQIAAVATDTATLTTGPDTSTNTVTDDISVTINPTAYWAGQSGDDWTTANDWTDSNGVTIATPNELNNVIIDQTGTYTLTIASADAANSVTITAGGAGADVQDETGGSLTITGALTIDAGTFSLAGGSLTAASIYVGAAGHFIGEGTVQAPLDNDGGTVEALGNLSLSGAVSGAGTFQIETGNTLDFGSSVATGAMVSFAPLSFQTVDDQNASGTGLFAISNSGEIVGADAVGGGVDGSILINGQFTEFQAFSDTITDAVGVNDAGVIVGGYDPSGHAFEDNGGTITNIDPTVLGASSNGGSGAVGINDSGVIVGVYSNHSFELDNGVYSTIDLPNNPNVVQVQAIDDNGDVAGAFSPDGTTYYGFVLTAGGQFETLSIPVSFIRGINDSGDAVGFIGEPNDREGFLDVGGTIYTVNAPGSTFTQLNGINDQGEIVGFYYDQNSIQHGFTTTVQAITDPGTMELNDSAAFHAQVANFAAGAVIDLTDIAFSSTTAAIWNAGSGQLTIDGQTFAGGQLTPQTDTISFANSGAYNQNSFALTVDSGAASPSGEPGTEIIFSPAQVTVSGQDTGDGNAVEGQALTATLTSYSGVALSNVNYTWLDGGTVEQTGANDTYTPQSDLGNAIDVIVSFNDPVTGAIDQITAAVGAVEASGGSSTDTWNGTGDWINDAATDWSLGSPPSAGAQVTIASGQAEINSNLTLDGNTIQNNAEIDVGVTSGAILTLDDGTTISDGTWVIEAGSTLEIVGTVTLTLPPVTNQGTLQIDANATLILGNDLGLNGGGNVTMASGSVIDNLQPGSTQELDNFDNTISGNGTIGGNGGLTLVNESAGTIDATGGTLIVDTGNIVTNHGLLEATNSGTLDVQDATIDNDGSGAAGIVIDSTSTLMVDNLDLQLTGGGTVTLEGGQIIANASNTLGTSSAAVVTIENVSGTIQNSGTIGTGDGYLVLQNDAGGTIDATAGTLTLDTGNTVSNSGLIEATNNGTLDVQDGDINWTGATPSAGSNGIVIDGSSTLLVDTSVLQLTGGGDVTLEGGTIAENANNALVGSGAFLTLDNVDNTISGSGLIGNFDGFLVLTNEADGTIDANVAFAVSGAQLSLDTGNTIENAGTLEASSGGYLLIHDAVDDTGNGELLADGGTIEIGGAVIGNEVAAFGADGGTFLIDHPDDPNTGFFATGGTISGFVADSTATAATAVDLDNLGFGPSHSAYTYALWDNASNNLQVFTVNGQSPSSPTDVNFTGTYSQNSFVLRDDGSGGTAIIASPATLSFLAGLDGNGDAVEGQQITVELAPVVADANLGTVSYEWFDAGVLVQGDTTNSYTPTGDAGDQISVVASFTDPNDGVSVDYLTADAGLVQVPAPDTWNGTGDWINAAASDWSTGAPPNTGDAVVVASGQAQVNSDVTLNNNAVQNSAEIDVGVTSGAILTLDDGTSISGGTLVLGDGASGTLRIETGATLSGGIEVSNDGTDFGTIEVTTGTTLTLDNATINGHIYIGNIGEVDVTGSSTLEGDAWLAVGATRVEAGQTLTLDGDLVTSNTITVGGQFADVADPNATPPASSTSNVFLTGINSAGQAVGDYIDGHDDVHGFIYDASTGQYTALDDTTGGAFYPASGTYPDGTLATGINNSGNVVGSFTDSGGVSHGFIYTAGGNPAFTTVDAPGADATSLDGINNSNEVFGSYSASGVTSYFTENTDGSGFTPLSNLPTGTNVTLFAINDSGSLLGTYNDANGNVHSFVYANGTSTEIIDPDAEYPTNPSGSTGTQASAFNNAGVVAGTFFDTDGVAHGFVATPSGNSYTYVTLDDPAAVFATDVYGINNNGQVLGQYSDGSNVAHGFIYDIATQTYTNFSDPSAVADQQGDGTYTNNYGANGINDNGEVIGSYSSNDEGGYVPFLYNPGAAASTLLLDDGTLVSGNTLILGGNVTLDVELGGSGGNGATLDGVTMANGGAIEVDLSASGAILTLDDGTTITGGTLDIEHTGSALDITLGSHGGNGATLDDVAVTSAGTIAVDPTASGAILTLDDGTSITGGTLTVGQLGTLDIGAAGGGGAVGDPTLDGVTVTLESNGSATGTIAVDPSGLGEILTLDDNTTISGGKLTISSAGVVDIVMGNVGQGSGATLDGVSVTNGNAINVDPTASGAVLTLDDGTTITGGTLSIGSAGELVIGSNLNDNGATLYETGIDNAGTISIDAGTTLNLLADSLDRTVTLQDGGTVSMAAGSELAGIAGSGIGQAVTLDNVDNTISGAGTLGSVGNVEFTIKNEASGIIDANVSGQTLDLEAGSPIQNFGVIEATNGGILRNDSGITSETGSSIQIGTGGTVIDTDRNIASDVVFAGSGTLDWTHLLSYSGTISDFGFGDAIDLADFGYAAHTYYSVSAGTLTVASVGGASEAPIGFSGTYNQESFALHDDGTGNTELIANPTTVTVSGLDGSGNPAEGQAITVTLSGQSLNDVTYTWIDGGVVSSDNRNIFTPTGDADNQIVGLVSFDDPNNPSTVDTVTAVAGTVPSATDTWTGGGNGLWSDASNWSHGVPTASSDVTISGATVTIDTSASPASADSVTTDGSTTLDITSGSLTISGTGTSDIAGTLDNAGSLVIENGTVILAGAVTNSSLIDVTDGGQLALNGDVADTGGQITAESGQDASIELAGAVITGGALSIGDGAVLYVEGAGGTLDNVDLQNSGDIQVDLGQQTVVDLVLADGAVVNGGTLTVGDSGLAEITGGLNGAGATLSNTDVTLGVGEGQSGEIQGAIQIDASSVLTLDTTTISGSTFNDGNITLTGGIIDNNGTIDVTGTSTINDGATLNGGSVTVESGQTLTLHSASVSDSNIVVGAFVSLTDPTASPAAVNGTDAVAINASGAVAGTFLDASFVTHGFIYSNGTYAQIDDPDAGSQGTTVTTINNSGEVSGYYTDASNQQHGFIYAPGANPSYTTVDGALDATSTQILGLNDSGVAIGHYFDGAGHGFVFAGGATQTLDDPLGTSGNQPVAINDSGAIVGIYTGTDGGYHSYIYTGSLATIDPGAFATLDDPNAVGIGGANLNNGTQVSAINGLGEIAGYYWDTAGISHGFVYNGSLAAIDPNGFTTIDDPNAVNGTEVVAVNDAGVVVGSYLDANSQDHAFVATPDGHGGYIYSDIANQDFAFAINDSGEIAGLGTSFTLGYLEDPAAGASIVLSGHADITATTLTIGIDDTAEIADATLDNVTVNNAGAISIGTGAQPIIADTVTLQGGGTVTLGAGSQIGGPNDTGGNPAQFDNVDNTITGVGQIGDTTGDLALTNSGVIDADGTTLTINTGNTVTNGGLLEATNSGTLLVQDAEIDNTGTGSGTGIVVDGTSSLLIGNSYLDLTGGGTVTLEGGGKILANVTSASMAAVVLENISGTIHNSGVIGGGDGYLSLRNDAGGTIDADAAGATLTLDTGGTIDNAGTLEATNGGTLLIDDSVHNSGTIAALAGSSVEFSAASVNDTDGGNNDGAVEAIGGSAIIYLIGTSIIGGSISASSGGLVEIETAGAGISNVTFDGSQTDGGFGQLAVTIDGAVQVDADASLTLIGTFNNDGTISIGSESGSATLEISGAVTLFGSGTIVLANNSDTVVDATGSDSLVNYDTITGDGQIGNNDQGLTLTNASGGVIDANVDASGENLTIDTGQSIANAGLMEATNGGTLLIEDNVANSGTIEANGGVVAIGASVAITGTASVRITDGGLADFQGSTTTTLDLNAVFAGDGGLELDNSQNYNGIVSGYNGAAVLYLHDINFVAGATSVTDIDPGIDGPGSDELQITNGTQTANIVIEGSAYNSDWAVLDWKYGGTLLIDPAVTVADGATTSASGSQMVFFAGLTGTLDIANPSSFTGEIAGMAGTGDVLDLAGLDTNTTVTATYNSNGTTTLALNDPGHAAFSLTLVDDYSAADFGVTFDVASDGHGGIDVFDPPAAPGASPTGGSLVIDFVNGGNLNIANGDGLHIDAPSNASVTFTGGTGSLVLNDPEGFKGQIIGFTGTAPDAAHSDTIDLVGINYDSAHFAESYNSTTGLLSVTDGSHTASFTFDNFNATLDFASDGNGGTLITDPPANGSPSEPSASPAVKWGMDFGADKIDFSPAQPANQSENTAAADGAKTALVLGNSGHDNFVFTPNLGTEANANLNPHLDTGEQVNHPNVQLVQQLAALVTPDVHTGAVFDLLHNDILGMNDAIPSQTHQIIQAGHLLH